MLDGVELGVGLPAAAAAALMMQPTTSQQQQQQQQQRVISIFCWHSKENESSGGRGEEKGKKKCESRRCGVSVVHTAGDITLPTAAAAAAAEQ